MTAFTWYGNQSEADACRFGALAVVFPLIERMKVVEIINQHLPADEQAEFDYGTILSLLMAARLYSPIALINVPEWAKETGADILWGIPPEKLNDDRLGRALDAFFKQRHSILAHLALQVSREFRVPLQEVHYDPTHLLFTGAYEDAQAREGVSAITAIAGTLIDVGEGIGVGGVHGVPVPLLFLFRSCGQRVIQGMRCPRA